MSLNIGDLLVVTGPLKLAYEEIDEGNVRLHAGEVVQVTGLDELPGDALVYGLDSDISQYIDIKSLTPLSEIQDDPDVEWGDPADGDLGLYLEIHDYVYEGDE